MGGVNVYEKDNVDDEPKHCTYCTEKLMTFSEFYPHEAGGYCIFAPRDDTNYACETCAFKNCADCGKKLPRYMFLDCNLCGKVHCFNNTDMTHDNNPMLSGYGLCDARHCGNTVSGGE